MAGEKALVEGNPNSSVRVIIYEDLQCPDCAAFRAMMDQQILPRYASKVAFEHRDFPLPKHAWARKAAVAARYFQSLKPELAIDWRRYALSHLGEITGDSFESRLAEWASAHGLDPAKAKAALNDRAFQAAVEEDYQDGVSSGIAHTPTVVVDGEPFVETFTFEQIAKSLDKAAGGK